VWLRRVLLFADEVTRISPFVLQQSATSESFRRAIVIAGKNLFDWVGRE
jgi:hypothetical protein